MESHEHQDVPFHYSTLFHLHNVLTQDTTIKTIIDQVDLLLNTNLADEYSSTTNVSAKIDHSLSLFNIVGSMKHYEKVFLATHYNNNTDGC